jgi:hypothetical protein
MMVTVSGGDGSSLENAIKISDCSHSEGVAQEYKEIRKKFVNYRFLEQLLLEENEKMYDKLVIEVNGKKEIIFFDITDFFGKF